MAPGQKKPPLNFKKKKTNNENSSKQNDGESNQNHSHAAPSSPLKVIQTPISKYQ
jgi:hypothetical protein